MSSRVKNIIIVILSLVVACLLWMLFDLNYGRYCKPIIRDVNYPVKGTKFDSTKKIKFESPKSY